MFDENRNIKNIKLITNNVEALVNDRSIPKGDSGIILNISNCSNILYAIFCCCYGCFVKSKKELYVLVRGVGFEPTKVRS
jgi:hypothetical protein